MPLVMPLAALSLILFALHRAVLYALIWLMWLPKGKDVLLVYSDSPIWHEYMMEEIVPLAGERAILLNWSERGRWPWWSFKAHVFRSCGGGRDFNPLVVFFRPWRRARVFRFWSAFKGWKRGYTGPLERLKEELVLALR
jgi:hypothetical protein